MGIEFQQYDDNSRRMVDDATGNIVSYVDATSRVCVSKFGTVARTDTSAKNLFTIPGNAQLVDIKIWAGTLSNAGTTATVSVGKTGSNTFFVNAFDVKGGTAGAQNRPTASNMYASVGTSAIQVVGIYAETGAASNTGGPFNVMVDYIVPNP